MTSQLQVKANRGNALKSTGPRSDAGKDRARWNAMSHGLRATLPIVPGESSSEWKGFREGVLDDLKPVGMLERELAERVALLSWRMRRVTASESVGIIIAGNKAVKQLTGASLSAYESAQTRTVVNVRERLQERVKQHAYADRVIDVAAQLERADDAEAISGDDVTVDFNPPLAGQTLNFEVTVVEVRDATTEELEHGHAHGEDMDDEDE